MRKPVKMGSEHFNVYLLKTGDPNVRIIPSDLPKLIQVNPQQELYEPKQK